MYKLLNANLKGHLIVNSLFILPLTIIERKKVKQGFKSITLFEMPYSVFFSSSKHFANFCYR